MDTSQIYNSLKTMGFIPVAIIGNEAHAVPLAKALKAGELPCVEVVLRSEQALPSIEKIAKQLPDVLVGAGTVLNVDQVKKAIDMGAKFIVTPGFSDKVVEYCLAHNIVIIPSTAGTAHIDATVSMGLKIVKFFPAEDLGGLPMLESLGQVYPITFVPTGGIDIHNLGSYIRSPYVHCVGGTWVCPKVFIANKNFDEITERAKSAVAAMLDFNLMHIGINAKGRENAQSITKEFSKLLGQPTREVPNLSFFVGNEYEIMFDGLGTHGHLAFGTNAIDVAMRILLSRGYKFKENFVRYDENGNLLLAYLENEIGGFACHLVQKNYSLDSNIRKHKK